LVPPPHETPQLPQFALSELTSTQRGGVPHIAVAAQLLVHIPATQPMPVGQTAPQRPQFEMSVRVSTHAPPHTVCEGPHAPSPGTSPCCPSASASCRASEPASTPCEVPPHAATHATQSAQPSQAHRDMKASDSSRSRVARSQAVLPRARITPRSPRVPSFVRIE
jgi:hypothetical protein